MITLLIAIIIMQIIIIIFQYIKPRRKRAMTEDELMDHCLKTMSKLEKKKNK